MRKIEVSQFRVSEFKDWVAASFPEVKSSSKLKAFTLFNEFFKKNSPSLNEVVSIRVLRAVEDVEVKDPFFEYVRRPGMENAKKEESTKIQGSSEKGKKPEKKFATRFPVFFTDARLTFIQTLQKAGEAAKGVDDRVSVALSALADGIYAQKEFDENVFTAVWNLAGTFNSMFKGPDNQVRPELSKSHGMFMAAMSLLDVCHVFGKADFGEVTSFVRRLEAGKNRQQSKPAQPAA